MSVPRVGGEVDSFCTRCKMTLAHTILAMVASQIARVQCNTCGGQHSFRSLAPSTSPRPTAPRAAREVISFAQRVSAKDPNHAKVYSPKERFELDELVRHPSFGIGIVNAVRGDKIDVAFKAFEKTLVHGRT